VSAVPVGRETWDAVVIGAGVGGLVCAGYLAACGRRVLVVEQHDVAGGNGHVFRRRRAYEFDVGVHYLGDCGPGGVLPSILAGLGLRDRVRFLPMDQDGFDRIIMPSLTVAVPAGWDRYRDRLVRAVPEEAAGIGRCVDVLAAVGEFSYRSLRNAGDLVAEYRRQADLLRWAKRSMRRLFDEHHLSPRARTLLVAQSGNYGSAPGATTVAAHATMLDHYLRGAYYPEGGGQVLVAALVEALEANEGELRTRCTAERILVEDGRVTGVRLADGTEAAAPLVVAGGDYRTAVLELCGGERAFDPSFVARTRAATMRLPLSAVYVGLDIDLAALPNANIWWFGDEDIESGYAKVAAGQVDEVPFAYLSFASRKDPGAACPPGHGNFQVMTLSSPDPRAWGSAEGSARGYRRTPAYLKAKHRLTERLLDIAEATIGPFREHIVHLETATPLTNQRYTMAPGGSPYGLAEPRPEIETPLPGLYVVGSDTRFGSGIAGVAISGITCAARITGRRLLPDALAGNVLDDVVRPDRRPLDWDPLRVSRGRGRRHAKGLARLDGFDGRRQSMNRS
jgi:all-trans-retinol 13,14-reductase